MRISSPGLNFPLPGSTSEKQRSKSAEDPLLTITGWPPPRKATNLFSNSKVFSHIDVRKEHKESIASKISSTPYVAILSGYQYRCGLASLIRLDDSSKSSMTP